MSRIVKLIKMLAESDAYVRTEEICMHLKIRPRTLREDIRTNKDFLTDDVGVEVVRGSNKGYKLNVINKEKYYDFLKKMLYEDAQRQFVMPVYQEDRVSYIIRYLLGKNDYVTKEDLADEIFVSVSTLNGDLRIVKKELLKYNLNIITKVNYGMKIEGEERNIRSCISDYYYYNINDNLEYDLSSISNTFNMIDLNEIKEILYSVIYENKFKMNDIGFQNLIVHLAILIIRIKDGTYVHIKDSNNDLENSQKEMTIANKISEKISNTYDINLPSSEVMYIAMHLMGKRVYDIEDTQIIETSTLNLVNDILKTINQQMNINLLGDVELFSSLALHIQPLLNRIKYDMKLNNPLLDNIKKNSPIAFDLAIIAGKIIQNNTGKLVDDDELGFLALHLELSLNRLDEEKLKKKRIVIVCASGAGTAYMMKHNIQQIFKDQVQSIKTMNAFEVHKINKEDCDLIISTIPIESIEDVPVVQVNYKLNQEDINYIDLFISDSIEFNQIKSCFSRDLFFSNMSFNSKNEVISFLCEKLESRTEVPDNFKSLVFERESLSATDIGNGVAIPHPTRYLLNENKVVICHLDEPLEWGTSKVNFVFLLGLSKEFDEVSGTLQQTLLNIFNDISSLVELLENPNFETFIKLINTNSKNIFDRKDIFM